MNDFDPIQFKPPGPCGRWNERDSIPWIGVMIEQHRDVATAIGTISHRDGWIWAGHTPIYGWIQAVATEIISRSTGQRRERL